ncbi:CRISPR-associated helicase Cas3' [Clostridiaceae bacterium UIB06]|uniref:CRISPR-associated helicase Cas3 n=1 Tax=Clostridium thailandense TaxID=2794346 RepID=A0A949WRC8_9CLOT|nr:CRISPR-associated helicase Cas3' [Clostridium thailandense]MBV7273831.1 CRISPR-associated helicase Cas3' [Clostridium thailandense]MCH5136904.1 CRISPR-associated helicase Cas3' [Clostridiaceae bacterium UIB06]
MYFDGITILKIKELVNNKYSIYAHVKDECNESLEAHIDFCIKYFFRIMEHKGLYSVFEKMEKEFLDGFSQEAVSLFREMLLNTFVLHDMGKVNPYFQKSRLGNNLKIREADRYKNSHHSMLSSVIYIDYYFAVVKAFKGKERDVLLDFMMMNAYVISRHHGQLTSFEEFKEKFKADGEGEKLLDVDDGQKELFEYTYTRKINITISTIIKIFNKIDRNINKNKDISVYRYIYERFMLSMLVACDFYATSEFMDGVEIKDIGVINNIEEFYSTYKEGEIYKVIREYEEERYGKQKEFSKITDINVLRTEMFLDTEKSLEKNIDSDIFYLEAPTGSGKSNAATNLSFKLMEKDKSKNKIFYVYPFNTLVEQNINILKKVFEKEKDILNKIAVINSIDPIKLDEKVYKNEDEKVQLEYYKKALLNRQFLNYPMVLTTHVTLFKYFFGVSKEDVFPVHQLANSIIVLDEVQSYKNLIWGEIITFLTCFAKLLNIKFIIMSATMPDLNKLTLSMGNTVRLVDDRDKYFKNPIFKNRVEVDYALLNSEDIFEDLYIHVKEKGLLHKKILVEFINKNSAYEFYNKLKDDEEILCQIELMTGDDNISERDRILEKVKTSEEIILVATQVIEAGVDIDMDIGYKNISLLDSEEQFLGRINRSCKKPGCIVYFFKLDEATTIYREDIRNNKDITLNHEFTRGILIEKDFDKFYDVVIERLKNITGGVNRLNIENFFQDEVGKLNFREVDKRMQLISDNRKEISVYLSSDLVKREGEKIYGEEVWEKYKELLSDTNMEYAEKRVKLSKVRSDMNNFIYKIKWNENFTYNDRIGELYYIEDGDKYFKDGKLDKEKFISGIGDFI